MKPIATDFRHAVRNAGPGFRSIAPGLKSIAIVICLAGAAIAFTAPAAMAEVRGGKDGVTPDQAKKRGDPIGSKADTGAVGETKKRIVRKEAGRGGNGPKGTKPGEEGPINEEVGANQMSHLGRTSDSVYRDYVRDADDAFDSALDAKNRCDEGEFEYQLNRLKEMAKEFESRIDTMDNQVEDQVKAINNIDDGWPGAEGLGDDLKKAGSSAERNALVREARQELDESARDGKTSRQARDRARYHLDKLKELNDALKKTRKALVDLYNAIEMLKDTTWGCGRDHASYGPGPGNDRDMLAAVLAAQQGLSVGGSQGFVVTPFGRGGPPSALDAAQGAVGDRIRDMTALSAIEDARRRHHGDTHGGEHDYANQAYEAGYAEQYATVHAVEPGQPAAAETAAEPGAETRVEPAAATAQPTPRGPITLNIPASPSAPGGMTRAEVPRTTVTARPRGAE